MKVDEWEVPDSQVIIEKRLGEGFFGYVFQGVIVGLISNSKVLASIKEYYMSYCGNETVKMCTEASDGNSNSYFN